MSNLFRCQVSDKLLENTYISVGLPNRTLRIVDIQYSSLVHNQLTLYSLPNVSRNAQSSWPLTPPKPSFPRPLHHCPLNMLDISLKIPHSAAPHRLLFFQIHPARHVQEPHPPRVADLRQCQCYGTAKEAKREQIYRGGLCECGAIG